MTLVGVKIIWERPCLVGLDKRSVKFFFYVVISQLKVLPAHLTTSNLKSVDLVIFYYIILVYKLSSLS